MISYFTANKPHFGTQMGNDIMPLFHKHLEGFGKRTPRIDVLLHTHGGHTLTPNRLTYLIREYTEDFAVLVPFRAHSAGTTLALGGERNRNGAARRTRSDRPQRFQRL